MGGTQSISVFRVASGVGVSNPTAFRRVGLRKTPMFWMPSKMCLMHHIQAHSPKYGNKFKVVREMLKCLSIRRPPFRRDAQPRTSTPKEPGTLTCELESVNLELVSVNLQLGSLKVQAVSVKMPLVLSGSGLGRAERAGRAGWLGGPDRCHATKTQHSTRSRRLQNIRAY